MKHERQFGVNQSEIDPDIDFKFQVTHQCGSTRRNEMHIYINQNFDAKVASTRFDVMDLRNGKRGGIGVACMRFVEFLRHLASMLRHHSAIRYSSSSAQWTHESEQISDTGSPSESRARNLAGNQTGHNAGNWQDAYYATPAKCQDQTTKRLKPAVVASLVTT